MALYCQGKHKFKVIRPEGRKPYRQCSCGKAETMDYTDDESVMSEPLTSTEIVLAWLAGITTAVGFYFIMKWFM